MKYKAKSAVTMTDEQVARQAGRIISDMMYTLNQMWDGLRCTSDPLTTINMYKMVEEFMDDLEPYYNEADKVYKAFHKKKKGK
jgi:hypothetical protein